MNQVTNLFEVILAAVLVAVAIAMARAGECYYCVQRIKPPETEAFFISYYRITNLITNYEKSNDAIALR